jgi:3-isopropylmalate dehydrogenase
LAATTGPEVTAEALKVLGAVAKLEKFTFETTPFDWGGERYLKTGETLPPGGAQELKKFDAIYLGAVGHPDVKPGILVKGLLSAGRLSSLASETTPRGRS